MNTASDKLNNLKSFIYSENMSSLIIYLQCRVGLSHQEAIQACKQYRNYLFLLVKYRNIKIPPSYDINQIWESHALCDMQNYFRFINEINKIDETASVIYKNEFFKNGKFIKKIDKEKFDNVTKLLYLDEFKENLQHIRKNSLSKKLKIFFIIKHRLLIWIIATIIVPALAGMIVVHLQDHDRLITKTHLDLENAMRDLGFIEEKKIIFCKNSDKYKNNPIYLKILEKINDESFANLSQFVKLERYANERNLITEDLFNELVPFGKKINDSLYADYDFCNLKKDKQMIFEERRVLSEKIHQSEEEKKFF